MRWCKKRDIQAYLTDNIGRSCSVLGAQGHAGLRASVPAAGWQASDMGCLHNTVPPPLQNTE
jgi:hypothetical protein